MQKAPAPETGSAGTRESAAAAETNLEGQVRSLKEELVELQRRLDALGNAPKRARKRKD
jgi:uncharacterized protein YceH (UPF0502 family)